MVVKRLPTRASRLQARGGSHGRHAYPSNGWLSSSGARRTAVLGRLPVLPGGARRPARGRRGGWPRSGRRDRARDTDRGGRGHERLRRLAYDPHRRPRRAAAWRRAHRSHVSRLPAARRALLAHARCGRRPRRAASRVGKHAAEELGVIAIGERAPSFSLPDTEGTAHALDGHAATVVCFTCNHCPYALAWHERIIAVARDYAPLGARVLAINPNDAERYPRDSLEAMRARVERDEFRGVPYLRDESQQVARAYDAKTTPDVFVIDSAGILRYRGAPDADHDDPSQNAAWLRAALDAVLADRAPDPAETPPVGCSIKWRQ